MTLLIEDEAALFAYIEAWAGKRLDKQVFRRHFLATVRTVTGAYPYHVTVQRMDEAQPDRNAYLCATPGYIPQVGDLVDVLWFDETLGYVMWPLKAPTPPDFPWYQPQRNGNWTELGAPWMPPGVRRYGDGQIRFRGFYQGGVTPFNIGMLPPTQRSPQMYLLTVISNNLLCRVDVDPTTGYYYLSSGGGAAWLAMDGLVVEPAAIYTPAVFKNGWHNYGGNYQDAGFHMDQYGIVHLKGLVSGGTVGTPIFTLPPGFRPPQSVMWGGQANAASCRYHIDNNGDVYGAVNGSTTWQSLDGCTFDTAPEVAYLPLTYLNGWHDYGAQYMRGGYRKLPNGVVRLRGVIGGGATATSPITTLPVGYRPPWQCINAATSVDVCTRIDVLPTGVVQNGGLTGGVIFLSLDNITFDTAAYFSGD